MKIVILRNTYIYLFDLFFFLFQTAYAVKIGNNIKYINEHNDICLMLSYFAKVLKHWEQSKRIANKSTKESTKSKVVQPREFCDVITRRKVLIKKEKNMDKKERFAIAKKIARGEQSFVDNYVDNLLKECIIK